MGNMSKTKIEWTEKTWNPVTGCDKVSQGCKNCYAESIAKRFWGIRKFNNIEIHYSKFDIPAKDKKPSMYFVNSMSDLFHESLTFQEIKQIWDIMKLNPQHTFQVLTKRPEQAFKFYNFLTYKIQEKFDAKNIWLGVSVEDNKNLERIKQLEQIEITTKFISFEPLLERIDLSAYFMENSIDFSQIKWAIIGCESGSSKRNCELSWIEELVQDLKYFEIKTFVKQINVNGTVIKNINNFPGDLKIREYPNAI